jgi:hypothetical protein
MISSARIRTRRRALLALAIASAMPLFLLGCPKKAPPPAVEDSGPPPPPATSSTLELAPLEEDAGDDADAADASDAKKATGPGYSSNQLKIMACCNAMRAQAKALGSSPEAAQLQAGAAQCDMFAKQIGAGGNAPELAQLRALLKTIQLPAACNF